MFRDCLSHGRVTVYMSSSLLGPRAALNVSTADSAAITAARRWVALMHIRCSPRGMVSRTEELCCLRVWAT